jgi:hypothetical protein
LRAERSRSTRFNSRSVSPTVEGTCDDTGWVTLGLRLGQISQRGLGPRQFLLFEPFD